MNDRILGIEHMLEKEVGADSMFPRGLTNVVSQDYLATKNLNEED